MSDIQLLLYANWLKKLSALKDENAKHDFTEKGEARYNIAFAEAKQAYYLLCDTDEQLYDSDLAKVYAVPANPEVQNARN